MKTITKKNNSKDKQASKNKPKIPERLTQKLVYEISLNCGDSLIGAVNNWKDVEYEFMFSAN